MCVPTQDLPRSAAHPFYSRLNQILDQQDFDGYVEGHVSALASLSQIADRSANHQAVLAVWARGHSHE
jgi:hypothetical protein